MKRIALLIIVINLSLLKLEAQWLNPVHLSDMNEWTSTGGFIQWYNHTNNTPNGQYYGNGIQLLLGYDPRHGAQIVIPTFDQNIYFRRYAGGWSSWDKIWHTGNLNRADIDFSSKNLISTGLFQTINKNSPGATWDNFSIWSDGENSYLYANGDEKGLHIKSQGGNKIILESNVGIGTTDPKNLLDVKGTIHAQEVKVDMNNWSDFVFHPTYQLKPLTEVEKFIKTNGHLQDIPSAADVEQNGVNVGDMQKKLLQKVEELTLYVIEKDKQLAEQLKINTEQQQMLREMKEEIELLKKK